MKKLMVIILAVLFLSASPAMAVGPAGGSGGGSGLEVAADCDVAAYYAVGTMCQSSATKKVYVGTGAAITELAAGASGDVTAASANQTWGDGTGPVVWTYSVTGTDPTITVTAGAFTLNTTLALGANNITTTGSLGATGAGKLTKIWAVDAELTNYPTVNGASVFNQDVTSDANPSFGTLNLVSANSLNLGTTGSAVGGIRFKNATSGYVELVPITGALGSAQMVLGTTFTDAKWCSYASASGFTCNQTAPQAALTYPVTGVASPTAGYLTKWGVSGNAIVDGPKIGTFTDTKWCVYTTAGGLECTTNAPAGAGDFKADGTVPMTAAIVPNAANSIALGSATAEWADIYLGDGAIIYGQNDQSNTLTSSATGWTANRNVTATNFIPTNQADAAGEIGYADNAYSLYANSEDFSLTAGTNLWTFNSTTGATFKFTPALEVTGLITASGGISGALNGTVGATTPAAGTFTTITTAATASPTVALQDSDAPGADKEIAKLVGGFVDGADGAENGTLDLYVHQAGTTTSYMQMDGKNTRINVSKSLSLGANNITMTGSLGATGAGKLTKIWAVDAETTNIPTVGGTGILTSLTAPQFTTIELGAASDTTLARSAAGVITVEGAVVHTLQTTIDGSAHVHLTAAQMQKPDCHVSNYGQTTADVSIGLPTAAANLSCLFTVSTAQSNHWGVLADASDAIYIAAAAGTISGAGTDGAAAAMVAAQLGQAFACWSIKTGASAHDWVCKAVVIGTSTFEAHAAF